ncbi:hypothetical protein F4694_005431 [Bacillus niacini]|uniref:Uncharacterized protein n=1 Tax=Neobacillus niacini TaxID=86668 RepID=A0A852TIF5_9BACI|nr:hypothetical protein [Neobacillus niacini]NYE08583.1 hypothetical protein [Neobacillus niacini]
MTGEGEGEGLGSSRNAVLLLTGIMNVLLRFDSPIKPPPINNSEAAFDKKESCSTSEV